MDLFTSLVGFLLIALLVRIFSRMKSKHSKVSNLPPGPWKLPLIGNVHQLVGDLPHRAMRDLSIKYGPIMHLQLGEVSHVIVSSPEIAKQVLKTHDAIFASRPQIIASNIVSYGSTSIAFSPYGEYWRQIRRITNSEVLSPKCVQSFRPIREEQTSNCIKWIASNEGKPINFSEQVYSLSYTIISISAFGKKNEHHDTFIKLAIQVLKLLAGFNIADFYPSYKVFHSLSGVKPTLEKLHSQVDSIMEKIISDRKADYSSGKYLVESQDVVDVLLKHQDESAEFHLSNDNVKAVLLDIFLAGGESSAATVIWVMSEMMKNPSILRRAQEEVRMAFGGEGYVNEDKFDNLKYTTGVIKETLRLHPPGPFLLPRENSETVEINGYQIPTRTKVFVNAWAINRDPSYWQDAECFRPERFLGSLIDYKGKDYEYIPFGAGRRMCPGIGIALANVLMPIVHFLYYFDWELPNGIKCEDLDMSEIFGVTISKKNDLYMIPRIHNPLLFAC